MVANPFPIWDSTQKCRSIPWTHPISICVNPLANSHDSKYCLCVCFDQHRSSWKNQTMNRSPWLKLPHITMISWILGFFLFPLIWVFPKMDHQFKSLDHQFQNVSYHSPKDLRCSQTWVQFKCGWFQSPFFVISGMLDDWSDHITPPPIARFLVSRTMSSCTWLTYSAKRIRKIWLTFLELHPTSC